MIRSAIATCLLLLLCACGGGGAGARSDHPAVDTSGGAVGASPGSSDAGSDPGSGAGSDEGSGESPGGSTGADGGGSTGSGIAAPVISAFSADASAINPGRSVTLSWNTSGAEQLLLMPGNIDVTGTTTHQLTPGASTIYTLLAHNAGGDTQAQLPVRLYDWSQLAATLDSFLAPGGALVGYSFLLFDRNGSLYARAGGNQDMGSVESIASATKLASAAAIMTLVDAGKLELDRPVGEYFRLGTIVWPLDKAGITTRMLLNHTSGLPGFQDRNQPTCINLESTTTLQKCAQDIAGAALLYPPGTTYDYGGADYQVAGYLATVISGKNWQQFFADAIGTPLNMSSFTYGDPAKITNPRIAGGADSDAADYAQLLAMVQGNGAVGGVRVLSAAAVAELQRNQIAGKPVAYSPLDPAQYPGYSYGLFASSASLYAGSPGPEFSDPGLLGTTPWIDAGLGYGAVMLTTSNTQTGLNLWNAVRPQIISQLTGAP
ncbi:MAG TPA: serine hydrolase domain-containing protein [Nevskiaceae bacterium]|nr:serine hydrolase domain-containing protein [Nevskiaceae bacterium]